MAQSPPLVLKMTPPPEFTNQDVFKHGVNHQNELFLYPPTPEPEPEVMEQHQYNPQVPAHIPHPPQKRSFNRSRPKSLSKQQQSSSSPIFNPRPYEAIFAETAYLTAALQQQLAQAADLISRYTLAEVQLQTGGVTGKRRRRLRKQLNQLKLQMLEAAQQEKALCVRLSELYMEQQSRDTWSRMHGQYMPEAGDGLPVPLAIPIASTAVLLNAESPEFVPSEVRFESGDCYQRGVVSEKSSFSNTQLEAVEEEAEQNELDDSQVGKLLCNHGLKFEYQCPVEESGFAKVTEYCKETAVLHRDRRRSVPNLRSLWPEE